MLWSSLISEHFMNTDPLMEKIQKDGSLIQQAHPRPYWESIFQHLPKMIHITAFNISLKNK